VEGLVSRSQLWHWDTRALGFDASDIVPDLALAAGCPERFRTFLGGKPA
jgi:hypothetical protein